MLPDRVSNPRPLTYESGALPIALRGPARCKGTWLVLHIPLLVMNRLKYTESAVFISLAYSLFPKDQTIQDLFTPLVFELNTNFPN